VLFKWHVILLSKEKQPMLVGSSFLKEQPISNLTFRKKLEVFEMQI
jgi:hypothetical protein